MIKHPHRDIAASVRQRLLNHAREAGRPFSELLQYFAMERFLYRLSKSAYADSFVLKGALMLTVWKAPLSRPTMDIDLLGKIDNNIDAIIAITKDICSQKVEPDGITFDLNDIRGERITEDADYEGVHVRFHGSLGTARFTMQLDVGFGDVVIPAPASLEYPTILDLPAPELHGYTKESTIAEKFEAMVKLGALNSRMKDFFDIWLLSRQFDFEGQRLAAAVEKTFFTRRTNIQSEPTAFTNSFAEDPAKVTQWRGFIRKNRLTNVPQAFGEVMKAIALFLGPIAENLVEEKSLTAIWRAPGPWLRL
jgi:predicted nucleotidyltransferase component of viral defense system